MNIYHGWYQTHGKYIEIKQKKIMHSLLHDDHQIGNFQEQIELTMTYSTLTPIVQRWWYKLSYTYKIIQMKNCLSLQIFTHSRNVVWLL